MPVLNSSTFKSTWTCSLQLPQTYLPEKGGEGSSAEGGAGGTTGGGPSDPFEGCVPPSSRRGRALETLILMSNFSTFFFDSSKSSLKIFGPTKADAFLRLRTADRRACISSSRCSLKPASSSSVRITSKAVPTVVGFSRTNKTANSDSGSSGFSPSVEETGPSSVRGWNAKIRQRSCRRGAHFATAT